MKGSHHNLDFQFKTAENGDDFDLYDLGGASNADTSFGNVVGLPELQDSRDPEPTKRNGRYNLRKSLAWDSAFFTSAGVLDPEELSTMIGTDESEKNLLPRIEEDINGSTKSMSTFQSDNLTLESQEDDLFVDIRASIQRSSKKASIFTKSNCKKPDTKVDNQAISALEKEELACPPCNQIPKISIKKTSSLQAVKKLKGQPKQNTGKPGPGRALKQDSVQSHNTPVNSIAKTGLSTSVLHKPPMATDKTIPNFTSTIKRDTISAIAKSGCGSLKPAMTSRERTQPPKVPVATTARRLLSKPSVSSKSSLASSASCMVQSSKLSTSSDSSSSISSSIKVAGKSPSITAKRNILKTGNVVTGSVTKSSSRAAVKIKPTSSSTVSANTKTTKTSTSISPVSSISEWSSVSSSSSSRVNTRSNNSRTSIASICKSTDSDLTFPSRKNQSTNQIVGVHKNKEIALPCNNLKKASTGSLQAPARPSGLRLPSPKIGFFDGTNSRTPNKPPQSQSGSRNSLSRSEAAASTPKRSSNIKPKSSNVPTAVKVTTVAKANSALSKEKSLASANDALVLMGKDEAHIMSTETTDKAIEQKYDKADEVEVGAANRVIDVVTSAIEKNLGDLKKEILNEKSYASENDKENGNVMIHQAEQDRNMNISASGPMNEVLSEILDCAVSFPIKAFTSSLARSPFAQKNFVSDDECISISKVIETKVDDMRLSALPSMKKDESC